jgi:outer membrane biosynthesis protein TonB
LVGKTSRRSLLVRRLSKMRGIIVILVVLVVVIGLMIFRLEMPSKEQPEEILPVEVKEESKEAIKPKEAVKKPESVEKSELPKTVEPLPEPKSGHIIRIKVR